MEDEDSTDLAEQTAATAEEWRAQLASETRGSLLRLAASEKMSLTCCEGGDAEELFCLTEGGTRDCIVPCRILELSEKELATLPALLDQLTEAEERDLCSTLGKYLQESDSWRWRLDTLSPFLGEYAVYLDAPQE